MTSQAVVRSVDAARAEARRPHPAVIGLGNGGPRHPALGDLDLGRPNQGAARETDGGLRYGFPTLLLCGPAGERIVPGWRHLSEYSAAVVAVAPELANVRHHPLDPDDALKRHRSLTARELELLTAGETPRRGLRVDTATTSLWLHPEEARQRDLRTVGAAR